MRRLAPTVIPRLDGVHVHLKPLLGPHPISEQTEGEKFAVLESTPYHPSQYRGGPSLSNGTRPLSTPTGVCPVEI